MSTVCPGFRHILSRSCSICTPSKISDPHMSSSSGIHPGWRLWRLNHNGLRECPSRSPETRTYKPLLKFVRLIVNEPCSTGLVRRDTFLLCCFEECGAVYAMLHTQFC